MKNVILALMISALSYACAYDANSLTSLDAIIMGKSYHNNDRDLNENNTGFGLGLGIRGDDKYTPGDLIIDGYIMSVVYRNSNDMVSTITGFGPKWIIGNPNKFHVDPMFIIGLHTNANENHMVKGVIIPSISVGYDRYNVNLIVAPYENKTPTGMSYGMVYALALRINIY